MLRLIIRKEILEALRDRRALILILISVILLPLSGLFNYEYWEARRTSFDSEIAAYHSSKDLSDLRAYRPPEVMSVIAGGVQSFIPVFYRFGTDRDSVGEIEAGNIEAENFSLLSTFGTVDFLFIVQVVFGLLAFILAFDMIAGEKERGTLRMLMANSVPRDTILIGKFLGGMAVLVTSFLLGSLLFLLLLTVQDAQFIDTRQLVRFGAILVPCLIYLGGMFLIGLLVSSLAHSGRTAIIILLFIWIAVQLIIPKSADVASRFLIPVRSVESVRAEREGIIKALDEREVLEAGRIYEKLFGTGGLNSRNISADTPAAAQFKAEYLLMVERNWNERIDRVRSIEDAYTNERRSQRQLATAISFLSPSATLTVLVSELAGTGDHASDQFNDAAKNYYSSIRNGPLAQLMLSTIRIRNEGGGITMGSGIGPDWSSIPAFSLPDHSIANAITRNLLPIAVLLLYTLVPSVAAYMAFSRYDIR